jgi:CheY-specific phosphatase CheX
MISHYLEKELYRAAAVTFEELGFLFPSPDIDSECDAACEAVAGVRFFGPVSGSLFVTARGGLLPVLAANMLGEDDAPSGVHQYDALGEVANVICGNVLPSIGGNRAVFQLESPKVVGYSDSVTSGNGEPTATVRLSLDEGQADVMLYVEGTA